MDRRWAVLAALALARGAMGFQYQVVGAVAPAMSADLGIGLGQVGALVSLYAAPGLFLALLGGYLGQRLGDLAVTLAGLGLMALGGAAALLPGYEAQLAGRLVAGAGGILVIVLTTKMTIDWFAGPKLPFALGLGAAGQPVGTGLALLAFGGLGADGDWRAALLTAGMLAVAALVALALVYRRPPAAPGAAELPAVGGFGLSRLVLVGAAGTLLGLFTAPFYAMLGFAPTYLHAAEVPAATIAFVLGWVAWCAVFTVPLGGYLTERFRLPNAIIVWPVAVWCGFLLLVPALGGAPWPFLAMGVIGAYPVAAILSLPAEVLRPEQRAIGMGLVMTVLHLLSTVVPPFVGWTGDLAGDPGVPLTVSAVLLLLCIPTLGLFRLVQRRWPV